MVDLHQGNQGSEIAEFGRESIRRLPQASSYIKALVHEGPARYIDNAHVEMKAISLDNIILPIIIANPQYNNSNVCSPFSHFIKYNLEETIKRNKKVPSWLYKMVLGFLGVILKICQIDSVVYVNNWLFTTNPHQELSRTQIAGLTSYLQQKYPQQAIVFRGVTPYLYAGFYHTLRDNGYLMVKSRLISLLDASNDNVYSHGNIKKDLKKLKKTTYTIASNKQIRQSEMPRLTELYRFLYLDKHSYLNPQLNDNYFSLTVSHNTLMYKALKRNDRIDAFISYYIRDGVLTGAFAGYDPNLPPKLGLYRMCMAMLISEARNQGLLLNLSAGVKDFKVLRGAFPVVEYEAIYCRHLSLRKKLAWKLIVQPLTSMDCNLYIRSVYHWLTSKFLKFRLA